MCEMRKYGMSVCLQYRQTQVPRPPGLQSFDPGCAGEIDSGL